MSIIDKIWSKILNVPKYRLKQIKDYECYDKSISAEKWFVNELLINCDKVQDLLILNCNNCKID